MKDTKDNVKDGGIIGADFRQYNEPYGGGYARPDLMRYVNAALGGRFAFEYGPGGSNLEVTNKDDSTYRVHIFDDNNFDNNTLTSEERNAVGLPRIIMGKLIGKGGKKVKRDFYYDIPKNVIKK